MELLRKIVTNKAVWGSFLAMVGSIVVDLWPNFPIPTLDKILFFVSVIGSVIATWDLSQDASERRIRNVIDTVNGDRALRNASDAGVVTPGHVHGVLGGVDRERPGRGG